VRDRERPSGRHEAIEEEPVTIQIATVSVDAVEPQRLARFWSDALGWAYEVDGDGDVLVRPAEGHPDHHRSSHLLFLAVPEAKSGKNRIHLDLVPDDQSAEVERLEGLGATRASVGQTGRESWVVMADPEGNEFCILRAR
jgi:predicted enzyme related to lactoylglutathione lyase